VTAQPKTRSVSAVFNLSNIGIVGLNPTQDMITFRFLILFVLSLWDQRIIIRTVSTKCRNVSKGLTTSRYLECLCKVTFQRA